MTKGNENLPAAVDTSLLEEFKLCLKEPGRKLSVHEDADMGAAILDRVLSASTLEELDASVGGLDKAERFAGEAIQVKGIRFANSDFDEGEGYGVYLVIDALTQIGKRVTIGCGGGQVMAYLVRMAELGGVPQSGDKGVIFERATKMTARGYKPWNIRPAEFKLEEPFA